MRYLILVVMLFQIGCITTSGSRISESAMIKYKCTRGFVLEKVDFKEASKFCNENFREDIKVTVED